MCDTRTAIADKLAHKSRRNLWDILKARKIYDLMAYALSVLLCLLLLFEYVFVQYKHIFTVFIFESGELRSAGDCLRQRLRKDCGSVLQTLQKTHQTS
jgi:hypothetical protein